MPPSLSGRLMHPSPAHYPGEWLDALAESQEDREAGDEA